MYFFFNWKTTGRSDFIVNIHIHNLQVMNSMFYDFDQN